MNHKQLLANYRRAETRMRTAQKIMRAPSTQLMPLPDYMKLQRQEDLAIRAYSRALGALNDFEQRN